LTFAVDLRHCARMEGLVDTLTRWLTALFDVIASATGSAISVFAWPAAAIGIPPEILAAALLCALLLALWRAMGGYFT
jgi:hypothetical protein